MIFDLKNHFIVFNAGAGGNFVSGIAHKLMTKNLQPLGIAKSGSSHTVKSNRTSISFGTWAGDDLRFVSDAVKEEFYLDEIKREYAMATSPVVTWSHNYKNIPLYKKHFKKSKILIIAETSKEERLSCVMMNATKTLLDKSADIPLNELTWKNLLAGWKRFCIKELDLIKNSDIDTESLFSDRYDNNYYALILYLTIRSITRQYGMLSYLDDTVTEIFLYDNILYPIRHHTVSYIVGEPVSQYVTGSDVVLPYTYLVDGDSDLLIEKLSKLLDRKLLSSEKNFIRSEFKRYRSSQNMRILTDPVGFYKDLEPIALGQLRELGELGSVYKIKEYS